MPIFQIRSSLKYAPKTHTYTPSSRPNQSTPDQQPVLHRVVLPLSNACPSRIPSLLQGCEECTAPPSCRTCSKQCMKIRNRLTVLVKLYHVIFMQTVLGTFPSCFFSVHKIILTVLAQLTTRHFPLPDSSTGRSTPQEAFSAKQGDETYMCIRFGTTGVNHLLRKWLTRLV